MEQETIYLIGSKGKDGQWRKLVKCFDNWFYTEAEALHFLNNQVESDMRQFYAVFEAEITINNVKKIFDGRNI